MAGERGAQAPAGSGLVVVDITAADTHRLRRDVLRRGTPSRDVGFPEDLSPGTFHLGVREAEVLIGVSTWIPLPYPDDPERRGTQLRGMATDPAHQGRGVGRLLVEAGVQRCFDSGAELVWARARDSALAFYSRHGFEVVEPGFVDDVTALAHHIVVRHR